MQSHTTRQAIAYDVVLLLLIYHHQCITRHVKADKHMGWHAQTHACVLQTRATSVVLV